MELVDAVAPEEEEVHKPPLLSKAFKRRKKKYPIFASAVFPLLWGGCNSIESLDALSTPLCRQEPSGERLQSHRKGREDSQFFLPKNSNDFLKLPPPSSTTICNNFLTRTSSTTAFLLNALMCLIKSWENNLLFQSAKKFEIL